MQSLMKQACGFTGFKKTEDHCGWRCVWLLCIVIILLFSGCSEWDEISSCECVQQHWALTGLENIVDMEDDQMSTSDDACQALVEALQGSWQGIGDKSDAQIVFHADGSYEMWQKRRKGWTLLYRLKYWIGYAMHQGMLRTELHMELPDLEDYAVRYYMSDGVLHLEEPTWHEPAMRFVRME